MMLYDLKNNYFKNIILKLFSIEQPILFGLAIDIIKCTSMNMVGSSKLINMIMEFGVIKILNLFFKF